MILPSFPNKCESFYQILKSRNGLGMQWLCTVTSLRSSNSFFMYFDVGVFNF